MKAADHQQKLQPRDPLDAMPPPICYLMMPLKESAMPSRLAHDLRRTRVLGYGHRLRRGMALQGVEFHDLDWSTTTCTPHREAHRRRAGGGQAKLRMHEGREIHVTYGLTP